MRSSRCMSGSLRSRSWRVFRRSNQGLGRDRGPDAVRWGPRAIDLDLLFFGDRCVSLPDLEVPHPRLHERAFVLVPLADLAPALVHPVRGGTVEGDARRAGRRGRHRARARPRAGRAPADRNRPYAPGMAIAAVSISPMGVGLSVSEYVAAAIAVLEAQDRVVWQLDSMFTTLEGEPEDLFEVIRAMQEAVFAAGAERVGTVIKMDDRRDREATMADKIASVESEARGPKKTD